MAHSRKSGSKPERTALRQRMMDAGAGVDEVAAEMRRRWGFRPREAYRHAHGWSQDEAAVRFTGIAGRMGSAGSAPGGVSPAMVGTRIGEYERWPFGGRRPSPYVLTVLAEVYGTTVDALLDGADLGELPEQDRTVLAAVSTGRPPERPARPRRTPPTPPVPVGSAVLSPADARVLLRERVAAAAAVSQRLVATSEARKASVTAARDRVAAPLPGSESSLLRTRSVRRHTALERIGPQDDPAVLLASSATEAIEFAEWAEAAGVGPSALEQVHADVRVLARDFLTHPPLPVLRRGLKLRNRVFSLLEQRQRPGQARELYLAAGRLCGIAGWIAGDLGFPDEAGAHARTGWLCADLAESGGLKAWIRATQAKIAYWAGDPGESALLAEDGLDQGARDSVRVLLASLAARGRAGDGDHVGARRALNQAETEREQLSGEDEVGGLISCSEAQQSYLAGTTYLHLGEPARALEAADRAVWLFELTDPRERSYGGEAIAQLDAAIAGVRLGDLDAAAARLTPLLDLAPAKRLDLILRRADDLERLLRGTGEPRLSTAGRLADELADFRHAG